MTTLPAVPAREIRRYHVMRYEGRVCQVYSWTGRADGTGCYAEMWQPGLGWIMGSGDMQAHFIGWDRDPDVSPITAEEAERLGSTERLGYSPDVLAEDQALGLIAVTQPS